MSQDKRTRTSPHRSGWLGSRFLLHDLGVTTMAVLDILLAVGLVIVLNVAVTRNGCSWNQRGDWTAVSAKKRVYALSPKTVSFLKGLQKPVKVFVFVAPPGGQTDFMYDDIRELFTRMKSHTRYLHVEYVNIDTEQRRALELIKKHGLTLDRDAFMQADLGSAVGGQVIFVAQKRKKSVNFRDTVKYKLRDPRDPKKVDPRIQAFKGEELFLNALIAVTQQRQPRVCFTSGHGEASAAGFSGMDLGFASEVLKRQNFAVETLKKVSGGIPSRCDVLVIPGPKVRFRESEVSAVSAFLSKGGKLLLMPRTQDVAGMTWSRTGLEDLLVRHGIRIEDAVVVDLDRLVRMVPADRTSAPIAIIAKDGWSKTQPIGKAMRGKHLIIASPRALKTVKTPGLEVAAVLQSGSGNKVWGERDLYGRGQYDPKRDIHSPIPLVVASKETRKNGARVVVVSSYLTLANWKMDPNRDAVDFTKEFLLATFNWLTEQEGLVALPPRRPEHVKLELSVSKVNWVGRLVMLALPGLAVFLSLLVWILGDRLRRSWERADAGQRDDTREV